MSRPIICVQVAEGIPRDIVPFRDGWAVEELFFPSDFKGDGDMRNWDIFAVSQAGP